jgi:hypothetical protein
MVWMKRPGPGRARGQGLACPARTAAAASLRGGHASGLSRRGVVFVSEGYGRDLSSPGTEEEGLGLVFAPLSPSVRRARPLRRLAVAGVNGGRRGEYVFPALAGVFRSRRITRRHLYRTP